MAHDMTDLLQRQNLPLEAKVVMTQQRIRDWYEYWDGKVYHSHSALNTMHLRQFSKAPAAFCIHAVISMLCGQLFSHCLQSMQSEALPRFRVRLW